MFQSKKMLTWSMLFLLSGLSYAQSPSFSDLTITEADEVAKEFSGNFIHTTVSSAATLGDNFGFEVGVIGGLTGTPEIDNLSKQLDPDADDIDKLPHAAVYGAITVPFGFTFEANFVPSFDIDEVDFKHFSLGAKWTFSKFLDLPFDMALRLSLANSEISYLDVINGFDTTITFDSRSVGYNLSMSKKFAFFEPYIGIGRVSNDTEITAAASGVINFFGSFIPASDSQSYETKNSGTHFFAGLNLNLYIFKAGVEYTRVMGLERYSGKLSFYF